MALTPYPVSPFQNLINAVLAGAQTRQQMQDIRQQHEAQQQQLDLQRQQMELYNKQLYEQEQAKSGQQIDWMMQQGTWDAVPDDQKAQILLAAGRPAPISKYSVQSPMMPLENGQLPQNMPLSALNAVQVQNERILPRQPVASRIVTADDVQAYGLSPTSIGMRMSEALAMTDAARKADEWRQKNTKLGELYASDPETMKVLERFPMLKNFTHTAVSPDTLFSLGQTKYVGDLDAKMKGILGLNGVPSTWTLDEGLNFANIARSVTDKEEAKTLNNAKMVIAAIDDKFKDNPDSKWKLPVYQNAWNVLAGYGMKPSAQPATETAPTTAQSTAVPPTTAQPTQAGGMNLFPDNPMLQGIGGQTNQPSPPTPAIPMTSAAPTTPTTTTGARDFATAVSAPPPTNDFAEALATPVTKPAETNPLKQTLLERAGGNTQTLKDLGIPEIYWQSTVAETFNIPAVKKWVDPSTYQAEDKANALKQMDYYRKTAQDIWSSGNFDPQAYRDAVHEYNDLADYAFGQGYTDDNRRDVTVLQRINQRLSEEASAKFDDKAYRQAQIDAVRQRTSGGDGTRPIVVNGVKYTQQSAQEYIKGYYDAQEKVAALEGATQAQIQQDKSFTSKLASARAGLWSYSLPIVQQLQQALGSPIERNPPPPDQPSELVYTNSGPFDMKGDKRTPEERTARTAAVKTYITNLQAALSTKRVTMDDIRKTIDEDRKWFNKAEQAWLDKTFPAPKPKQSLVKTTKKNGSTYVQVGGLNFGKW